MSFAVLHLYSYMFMFMFIYSLRILKRSRDCLLYTKKDTKWVVFIVNTLHYFYLT